MDIERLKEHDLYVLRSVVGGLEEEQSIDPVIASQFEQVIDEALANQFATSEEVAEAIELFEGAIKYRKEQEEEAKKHYGGRLPDFYLELNKKEALAITALQAYQPWIPCSKRMPTEDDADEDGFVLTLDADRQQTDYPYSEIDEWNNRCDVKITHWRPMLPIPKGE